MADKTSNRLTKARERSKMRKTLIESILGVDNLATALGQEAPTVTKASGAIPKTVKSSVGSSDRKRPHIEDRSIPALPDQFIVEDAKKEKAQRLKKDPAATTASGDKNSNQEQEFRDSTAFLKGTQSLNPHNDYSQNFVDTEQRPQNFIRDVGLADRFEEYPKLRELIKLKNDLVAQTAHPPMYLKCDLENFDLKSIKQSFDVILIEPPLEEYARSCGVTNVKFWDWDKIMALDIAEIAAQRAFVFLWCGSSDGLDLGRLCLQTWGFRRCEDICWIQTNHKDSGRKKVLETNAVFQRTKEHCLMGIKGTVRRSTDGDFIHANVDIDLIIDEEAEPGSLDKPVEMFHIIEHFCLGRRRIHIFGRDTTIRPGWLTIGPDLSMSNYDNSVLQGYYGEGITTGCTDRIEALRPKSPPPKSGSRGGRGGRGAGSTSVMRYRKR